MNSLNLLSYDQRKTTPPSASSQSSEVETVEVDLQFRVSRNVLADFFQITGNGKSQNGYGLVLHMLVVVMTISISRISQSTLSMQPQPTFERF